MGRDVKVYKAVKARSGGVCERCHRAAADNIHHKRLKSQGGAGSLLNLVHLCAACHTHIHAQPAESYEAGWMISARIHGAEVARMHELSTGATGSG